MQLTFLNRTNRTARKFYLKGHPGYNVTICYIIAVQHSVISGIVMLIQVCR